MALSHFVNNWWNKPEETSKPVVEKPTCGYYRKDDPIFTEEEMVEYGIQSVSMISEATWAPRLMIKLLDGRQISCAVNRNMLDDMRSYMNIDVRGALRDVIRKEVEHLIKTPKKEIIRVYSESDPYGEENWED